MTTEAIQDSGETRVGGEMLAQISNEMVGLYKGLFGRGPTRARTNWAGPDTLICTLENSLTPAEKSLVALGENQRLRDVRLFFQHATEDRFREVVERLTSREVRGFVSGMDVEQDIAAELFYLVPEDGVLDAGLSEG
ncbi:MAG: Na-translocating system protein MpsC family protein [Thermoleophilaceae bacterium]|jgi:uncharacterized protein YbcI